MDNAKTSDFPVGETAPEQHDDVVSAPGEKLPDSSPQEEARAVGTNASSGGESHAWQRTIDESVRSIVSVRFCHPTSFDTEVAQTSEGSGFIVDAKNGYVLTNRHIVGAGPFWGSIAFYNQEEVDAFPVYRDPIHDFGILRFNPEDVKHTDISALTLRPDLAKVGVEIRVIGNDVGEKLSILSGFINRLDRNAPIYSGYQDFNTCYYQANAAAAGGSSGSPVVNIDGYVIALQAGVRTDGASTDYFLPLHGPLRAIQLLQQEQPIMRGDIQCKFLLKPFDECRRLGLKADWETAARKAFPHEDHMLVVETVIPDGPSDGKIKEGDIIITVNGELTTQFLPLSNIFNSNIGKVVSIVLQRGGEDVEVNVAVQDLEKVTPSRILSAVGANFNELSYQMAQRYAIACRGVYVAEAGLLQLSKRNGWLIESIDYRDTPCLDKFIEVVKSLPDKARVIMIYKDLSDLHTTHTSLITINKHWSSKMKLLTRNDKTGIWDIEILADALPPSTPKRSKVTFRGLSHIKHPAVAGITRSFVHVQCTVPFLLDGGTQHVISGIGLIIDAERGIVLISRTVVRHRLCDIVITVADSVFIEGRIIFLHPSQNYTLLQYDPELLDAPVQTAVLSTENITQGTSTLFVGYDNDTHLSYAPTIVTAVRPLAFTPHSVPRYRPMNADKVNIETSLGDSCNSGVLMTESGIVQAVWLFYDGSYRNHFGLEACAIVPVISSIRDGTIPKLRLLPVEFEAIPLFQARVMGVSDEWITKAEEHSLHHQLFMVKRIFNDHPGQLLEGDILLSLNGKVITMASELDVLHWHETLEAVVVRRREQINVELHTVADDDVETTHIATLCGVLLQKPHLAVRQHIKELPSEVYISSRFYGAPSSRYNLWSSSFITHMNGTPTPTLESLVSSVANIPDNTYFQLRGCAYDKTPFVITIKKNERFYPTTEWISDPKEPWVWARKTYEDGKVIEGEGDLGVWM